MQCVLFGVSASRLLKDSISRLSVRMRMAKGLCMLRASLVATCTRVPVPLIANSNSQKRV